MKFRDEYRDPAAAHGFAEAISCKVTRPWTLMEVCGGQTHAIVRFGIDRLLPTDVSLVHGPGCPVCVTPVEYIDKAIELASRPGVTLCSFGDMLRVPGTEGDLLGARARGGDVRFVYSPLDALAVARAEPDRRVVFFAVGFETTAPANAMAVYRARREGIRNFSMLVSHVLVPPAMRALLDAPTNRVQGFLAAGHVCTVMGYEEYEPIAAQYRVPIVVTGFEPLDILEGVYMCVSQLEQGRGEVENQYSRSVRREGNRPAQDIIREVFQIVPRRWRGIGEIAHSGLGSPTPISTTTQSSGSGKSRRRSSRKSNASAASCCAANASPRNAPLSAPGAHLSGRWASQWFLARVPVQPITAIAGPTAR
jgi:hydrogenase expression/formation protein HypD